MIGFQMNPENRENLLIRQMLNQNLQKTIPHTMVGTGKKCTLPQQKSTIMPYLVVNGELSAWEGLNWRARLYMFAKALCDDKIELKRQKIDVTFLWFEI